MFRPPSLLTSQIVPTAALLLQGSRGFYVRAEHASLASACIGYASRPNQATDGAGTLTLLDSQPCRLLPSVYASNVASRRRPQDSRSRWFATPSLWGSFIPDSLPVYPGAHNFLLAIRKWALLPATS